MRLPVQLLVFNAVSILLCAGWAQEIVWQRVYDVTSTADYPCGAIDSCGNILLAGTYSDSGNYGIMLVKCNADGDILWLRRYDTQVQNEHVYACAADSEGGVVISGKSHPANSCLVIKYDSAGNLIWIKQDKVGYLSYLNGVAVDESLNIYVSGTTMSLNPPSYDLLLMKYNVNGDLLWVRTYDWGWDEEGGVITLLPDGNVAGIGSLGSEEQWWFDFLIYKFAPNGDLLWSRVLNVKNEDWGYGVSTDYESNIYGGGFAGQFFNGWIVPDSLVVFKYTPDGDLEWVKVFGNDDYSGGGAVVTDDLGNVLIAGCSYDTIRRKSSSLLFCYNNQGEYRWNCVLRDSINNLELLDIVGSFPAIIYGIGILSNDLFSKFAIIKFRYPTGLGEFGPKFNKTHSYFSLTTPVCAGATLRFSVAGAGDYRLVVRDVSGQERLVYAGYLPEG
ncbi:MAG: hypothetical protein ABIK51_03700, partial [candidate division WOR-3 bacterium]